MRHRTPSPRIPTFTGPRRLVPGYKVVINLPSTHNPKCSPEIERRKLPPILT